MIFEGFAGRFVQKLAGVASASFTSSSGALRVAQEEADGDEMTRAGLRYHLCTMAATGIASVAAIPTTAASWLIYNPLSNPVTAFLDRVSVTTTSGTGGATGGALLACIVPPKLVPTTVPIASSAGVVIQNANAVSAKGSSLIIVASQTLAAAGNWFPVANSQSTTAVLVGATVLDSGWDLRGKIAIPPGCGLALSVLMAVANAPLFAPIVSWREYSSDLE